MKKLVVAATAVVASLAVIGSAAAASLPSGQTLKFEGGGSHVWNKNGGSASDLFPNAYQQFTITIAGSVGHRIFVGAYSIHDQTHWLEVTL